MLLTKRTTSVVCAALSTLLLSNISAAANPASHTPTEPTLGELPEGANAVFEVRDLGAEVCLRHIFRPETVAATDMPAGYRLAALSERAAAPWIAELLRQRPELHDWANGSFCFIESGTHVIDGVPAYPGRRSNVAFLWADIVPTGAPRTDPRFRGAMRRVQLFWLYDSEGVDMNLARQAIPHALFGRITMEKSGDAWDVAIESDDGVLTAHVEATEPRRQIGSLTPGYETIANSDSARGFFHVVTFAGHHEQPAVGEWRATGSRGWARTFAAETVDAGSFIQDGFAAKLGLYRHDEP